MRTLFISDVHLSLNDPSSLQAFLAFLEQEAIDADALYILGDLFDFWIGDDDPSEFAQTVIQALKKVTDTGTQGYFVQGNRDFLVGKRFSRQTGFHLLGDVTAVNLYGRSAVILHGDTLCLDDIRYLAFRAKVHQPWLQFIFNHLPFAFRKKIVSKIQAGVKDDKSTKAYDIMDVSQDEVIKVMNENHVHLMIHGHTHRPKIHKFSLMNQDYSRVVLGDWQTRVNYLEIRAHDYLEFRYFENF